MTYMIAAGSMTDCDAHLPYVVKEAVSKNGSKPVRVRDIKLLSSNEASSVISLRGYARGSVVVYICDTFYGGRFEINLRDCFAVQEFDMRSFPASECV